MTQLWTIGPLAVAYYPGGIQRAWIWRSVSFWRLKIMW